MRPFRRSTSLHAFPACCRCHSSGSPTPQPSSIKIPYGVSDFSDIINGGYFWRDTSQYVVALAENGVPHQLFLRPPRFGKSLNMSMMQYFLDLAHQDKFDALFANTDIYASKEALKHRNKYHVMKFDFTVDVGDGSAPAVAGAFHDEIAESVRNFGDRYGFDVREQNPMVMMKSASRKIIDKGGKVFVLVDEYDRFANKLMFEHPEQYAKIVTGTSGGPHSSPLRSFFEAVKAVNVRSFTTGITPIALADASGANMIKDLTHLPAFGEMCGFRKADVVIGVKGVLGKTHEAVDRVVSLMEHYYNGYRFRGTEKDLLTSPLYNTQLCLYFMDWMREDPGGFGDKVINEWSQDPATADVKAMLDKNVAVSESVTRVLARHPTMPFIQAQLARGSLQAKVNKSLRLRELQEYSSAESLDRLSTFLFHHGLVTLRTSDAICIPNRLVEDLAKGLLSHLRPMITNWGLDVCDLVQHPTEVKIWNLLHTVLAGLGTKFDKSFSEGAVQAVVEGVLRTLPQHLLGGISVVCEEEYDPAPGPTPTCYKCGHPCAEKTASRTSTCPGRKYWKCCEEPRVQGKAQQTSFQWFPYRFDMYLKSGNDVVLLEFKRVRPGNVLFHTPIAPAWSTTRSSPAEDRALMGGGCDLSRDMKNPVGVSTLQDLEDNAQAQCKKYKSELTTKGLNVTMACTVIHWTYRDDCPSALLVKEVK